MLQRGEVLCFCAANTSIYLGGGEVVIGHPDCNSTVMALCLFRKQFDRLYVLPNASFPLKRADKRRNDPLIPFRHCDCDSRPSNCCKFCTLILLRVNHLHYGLVGESFQASLNQFKTTLVWEVPEPFSKLFRYPVVEVRVEDGHFDFLYTPHGIQIEQLPGTVDEKSTICC